VKVQAAVTSGSLVVRAYDYLPSDYVITDLSLLELRQRSGAKMVLGGFPGVGLYNGVDERLSTGERSLPRDVWSCIEVHLEIPDAPHGSWEVWVDGVLGYAVSGLDAFDGGIEGITIGITWAGPSQDASTVYADAVAASRSPIGCL